MHYSQKPQFKYPAWVTERRQPPPEIREELRIARVAAAQAAEERRAKRKNKYRSEAPAGVAAAAE